MLIQLCWLASEARGSSCLRPPSGGVRDTTNLLGFLLRFWGSKLRSLYLHSRHVTDLVLSSAHSELLDVLEWWALEFLVNEDTQDEGNAAA